ncbi:MAG: large conductance mechanosensitive channel protein MscL [Ruminococcaceae bacterium]|nr:large conductance mechanosensitive channel protein MscL [Oscillospiraceae bacterium]
MKKIIAEFKEFINRGSVVDMAVGIMIGAAFKAIVDALVNNLISPLIGIIVGQNFDSLSFTINDAVFQYGAFIMAILNFFIIAVVLFALIKLLNTLHSLGKKKEVETPAAPTTKICPFCKSEIPVDAVRCAHCTSNLND